MIRIATQCQLQSGAYNGIDRIREVNSSMTSPLAADPQASLND